MSKTKKDYLLVEGLNTFALRFLGIFHIHFLSSKYIYTVKHITCTKKYIKHVRFLK